MSDHIVSTGSQSVFTSFGLSDPTRAKLAQDAHDLDIEYRGSGTDVDASNIDERVRSVLNADRLKKFAVYLALAGKVIDVENKINIRPPIRNFRLKNGKSPSKAVLKRIAEIYEQMDFNAKMLSWERQAAYEGTLFVKPTTDWNNDSSLYLMKESPSNPYNDIIANPLRPSVLQDFNLWIPEKTDRKRKRKKIDWLWTPTDLITTTFDKQGKVASIETIPHGFNVQPWVVLRYKDDSSRFYGPVDGSLLSVCQIRSLLFADGVHRTQAGIYEILVMGNIDRDTALSLTRTMLTGKIMNYEPEFDGDGKVIPKDIKFVSPEGMEPAKIFDVWETIYRNFLSLRGHALKNFEGDSSLIQSAESQRNSMTAVEDIALARRPILAKFERELWKRILLEANKNDKAVKIPEGTNLILDYAPEDRSFEKSGDRIAHYEFMLKHNLMTPAEVLRRENQDYSIESAQDKIDENAVINKDLEDSNSTGTEDTE